MGAPSLPLGAALGRAAAGFAEGQKGQIKAGRIFVLTINLPSLIKKRKVLDKGFLMPKKKRFGPFLIGTVILIWMALGSAIGGYLYFEKVKERETRTAEVQILRSTWSHGVDIVTAGDFNSALEGLRSDALIDKVLQRLTEEEVRQLVVPYEKEWKAGKTSPAKILKENRRILPRKLSFFIGVSYRNPNREIAAKMANLFAEEGTDYLRLEKMRSQQKEGIRAVDLQVARIVRLAEP